MTILVINSGSSSLKFQVIDSENEEVLAKGVCERIGIDGRFTYRTRTGISLKEAVPMKNHTQAVHTLLDTLADPEKGVIKDFREIDVIGHRLVHGGEKFTGSVVITDEVTRAMTECNDLAPLHNPANLVGVEACRKLMPDTLRHFSMGFRTSIMRGTGSGAMAFMGSVISMSHGGPRNLWDRTRAV